MNTIYTIGYNAWPPATRVAGLTQALTEAGVSKLVDIRHSPCPSDPTGRSAYGPKPWTLQMAGGLQEALVSLGIGYVWIPELGNPQKNDHEMKILRWHLTDRRYEWPVSRGLNLLRAVVSEGHVCSLLCACEKYEKCHRRLIAEAFCAMPGMGDLSVINLSRRGPVLVSQGPLQ